MESGFRKARWKDRIRQEATIGQGLVGAGGGGVVQRPVVLMARCGQVGLYLEARAEIACIWVLQVKKIIDWILWISSFLMFSMRKQ